MPEGELPDVDLAAVEQEVAEASRSWDDRLSDALVGIHGSPERPSAGGPLLGALPGVLQERVQDLSGGVRRHPVRAVGRRSPVRRGAAERAAHGRAADAAEAVQDRRQGAADRSAAAARAARPDGGRGGADAAPGRRRRDALSPRFRCARPRRRAARPRPSWASWSAETFGAVWDGRAGSDWLNRLVVAGGLSWRQVTILRAYREYRQLLGAQFTSRYQNDCLVRNSDIARQLVALFETLFDPRRELDMDAIDAIREGILAALEDVASLDDDRILRGYLGLVDATVRTNAYVRGGESEHISFKLRCADVPGIPKPVPLWEIFVFSPAMAGVHLRGGYVARGGIRWSDRLEDYRTEILGLMKAQMVKNAVIVPVGAKGGFILKRPPTERAELMEEERRQYITLMRGLLDVTDNMVAGEVVHPADVRVLDDGDDAYLVVAADKGTAHLSDTANEISARVRILARRCVRVGRFGRIRPQGARHHRQGRLGERQASLPRARPRRHDPALHGGRRG